MARKGGKPKTKTLGNLLIVACGPGSGGKHKKKRKKTKYTLADFY